MLTCCSPAGTATYSPPSDDTCLATSGRTSVARTIAPRLLAAPIAASPATPAPTTSTFAGGTCRAEPDPAGARHQHLRRRHLAVRGDLPGEQGPEGVRLLDDRPVTGD